MAMPISNSKLCTRLKPAGPIPGFQEEFCGSQSAGGGHQPWSAQRLMNERQQISEVIVGKMRASYGQRRTSFGRVVGSEGRAVDR